MRKTLKKRFLREKQHEKKKNLTNFSWNVQRIMALLMCLVLFLKVFCIFFFQSIPSRFANVEKPKYRLLLGKLNYACEIPRCMHVYREYDMHVNCSFWFD